MIVYELKRIDLSGVGGTMGTSSTTDDFSELFLNIADAKSRAVSDYGKNIKWSNNGMGKHVIHSGDLTYCMYTIEARKVTE